VQQCGQTRYEVTRSGESTWMCEGNWLRDSTSGLFNVSVLCIVWAVSITRRGRNKLRLRACRVKLTVSQATDRATERITMVSRHRRHIRWVCDDGRGEDQYDSACCEGRLITTIVDSQHGQAVHWTTLGDIIAKDQTFLDGLIYKRRTDEAHSPQVSETSYRGYWDSEI
jgi:hypothetical protein